MRTRSDVRVSVRIGRDKTKRLDLLKQPTGEKYSLRVNGINQFELTITEFTDQLRRWIARNV